MNFISKRNSSRAARSSGGLVSFWVCPCWTQ